MSELHLSDRCAVTISRALGMVIVALHGEVVEDAAHSVSQLLTELIEGQGNLHVVVDAAHVDALDETAARALDTARACMERRGGRLALSNPSPATQETLDAMGCREEFTVVSL